MATNPYFTQYHTQRFSFIGSPQQRDGTFNKDQRFLNMYPELIKSPITEGKKYYLKKRPGVSIANSFTAGQGRGLFYWASNNSYYTAVGNKIYVNSTPLITMGTSTGAVGFTEFRTDSLDLIFLCDGVNAWTINTSNVVTTINSVSNPNFPSPHIPAPIFIDGYIFLGQLGSQTIHNSQLSDPYTWPSDGFIDAEMYPDNLVTLTKAQNYLVAVGAGSIEFFYDNANATGSPLQRNAPAVSQFGCPAIGTVNQTEKEVILVGDTGAGGRTVWIVDGFQPKEIANEPVREALDLEGVGIASASAFTIQCAGHKWYILNLYTAGRTFVYDFEEQMWHEWSSGLTQAAFPYSFGTNSNAGFPVLLHNSNGTTVNLSPTVYTDAGTTINCQITTSKLDFDTIMRKRFYRLSMTGDSPNGITNTPISVAWSDDDYNTFVGNITLNMNGSYPSITQLGYARRRAFQFTYQQPYALRLESFELDIIQEVRR
jgi:hypothetical protein